MSISQSSPEAEIGYHLHEASVLAYRYGFGDVLGYARSKEFIAAQILGHRISPTLEGADAFRDKDGIEIPLEYKSTVGEHCKGHYSGISVQETWPEQEQYLREEKIAKYPEHYYNRFESGVMVESWMMEGIDVYDLLLPKLKKSWDSRHNRKDPRLSANITWGDIQEYGTKVI